MNPAASGPITPERLQRYVWSFGVARALEAALKLRLFTRIAEGQNTGAALAAAGLVAMAGAAARSPSALSRSAARLRAGASGAESSRTLKPKRVSWARPACEASLASAITWSEETESRPSA